MTLSNGARLATALLVALPAATLAAEPSPSPPALTLQAAKPVELTCATKSVVVRPDAANATSGDVKLSLLLKDATAKPPAGVWRIVSVGAQHAGSLGQREAKACAEACPLTIGADGNIELWSSVPKAITQLADGEMLLLAVVKPTTLDLRATTFSGKAIESVEEGRCEVHR